MAETRIFRRCLIFLLLLSAGPALAASPKLEPLTLWNEPGKAAPARPAELAPWPPKDPAAREAWAEIAMLEDTRARDVSRLMGHLQSSPDPLVRWRVCRAFARLQDSTGVLVLLDALQKDDSPFVRQEAAFALGQIGSRQATQALIYAAREQTDRRVRARALEALGKIADPASRGVVAAHLTHPDPELSREAALACWRSTDSTAASKLAEASKGPDALTRAFCAYAMERAAVPQWTIKALDRLLDDRNVTVRAYAARALGRQQAPQALGLLVEAAVDRDFRVRVSALRAIGTLADSAGLPQVLGGLLDREPTVRETAAAAAAQLRSRDAAPALRKVLTDADPAVRLAAVRALVGLLGDEAWADVRPLLSDSERWVRAGTIEALGTMRAEEPRQMLRKVAAGLRPIGGNASLEERAFAFSGLAAGRSTTARAEIVSGIRDARWLVAASAAEAAGASADSTLALELAWLARNNPDPKEGDVPLAVYGALEALGPGAGTPGAGPGVVDSVRAVLFAGLESPESRQRDAAGRAYGAIFGADALVQARAAHPAPPWKAGALADYRAQLALEDSTGPLGRVTGATIRTARGPIELAFDVREAPRTVQNFVTLAEKGYYKDVRWHRIVPYFVAQDGDPTGTGSGGPGYAFRCEYNGLRYDTGAVGMALSGKDTGGSQYFITLSPQPHLDGRYTIFGHVVKGQDVVEKIRRGDRIEEITIHRR
jgi:cyclophilin family peptidyl-prolyl cis-trans isomerase/HEAT repeat protein